MIKKEGLSPKVNTITEKSINSYQYHKKKKRKRKENEKKKTEKNPTTNHFKLNLKEIMAERKREYLCLFINRTYINTLTYIKTSMGTTHYFSQK